MNDNAREDWINNHEPLYLAWKASGKSMRRFVREHRAEVDAEIKRVRG